MIRPFLCCARTQSGVMKMVLVFICFFSTGFMLRQLIREVYGVKATVDPDDFGRPCIHYAGLVDCEAAE